MGGAMALGLRVREMRSWRQLTVRDAAGRAGLSFSLWSQVERGDKAVANRATLEAMAHTLRAHPSELTGQPWAPQEVVSSEAHAGLIGIEIALARDDLGVDPGVPGRSGGGVTPKFHSFQCMGAAARAVGGCG